MHILRGVTGKALHVQYIIILSVILLSTQSVTAQKSKSSFETIDTPISLATDLALPIFGIYYVDVDIPVHKRVDVTFGLVYQKLPHWIMPDWSENNSAFLKIGASYSFSNARTGWLIYTDAFIGWMVLDTYKDGPSEEYSGMEVIQQIMGGYRFQVSDRIHITPLLGILYGYSWALDTANTEIVGGIDENAFGIGPALEIRLGFNL